MSELVTAAGQCNDLIGFRVKILTMPFKASAARRHRIPKQRYRVTNWAEYDACLRQRGSPTVWFSEKAIAAWRAEAALLIRLDAFR